MQCGVSDWSAIRGESRCRSCLEVIAHRITLDVIPGAQQQGSGRIVQSFLLDQGRQLGIANISTLCTGFRANHCGEGWLSERYLPPASVSIPDNTAIKRSIPIWTHICGFWGSIISAYIRIYRVQHIPPVGDVGHVLECVITIPACRRQELIRANVVGLFQIQRFTSMLRLYY